LADRPDRGENGAESTRRAGSAREKSAWWDIPLTIGIAVGVVLLITTFLAKPFSIPSGSMEDTLGIGDRVLVNRAVYHLRDIERGDVVVFDGSDSFVPAGDAPERNPVAAVLAWAGQSIGLVPPDSTDFIKRVIGVGGDTIEIRDKKIFLNGLPYQDAHGVYADDFILPGAIQPRDNFGPFNVPKGTVFAMGDNRDQSYDSRFWGVVDLKDVLGKAFILYWSWNGENHSVRWGRLGNLIR